MSEEQARQKVKIEIEDENETKEDNEESIKPNEVSKSSLTIPRKKVDELTEQERSQLIADARNGKENEFYSVKFFKNGNTHINLKKQTKAQEFIQANEPNPKISTPQKSYLTTEQLLMEHIINLESQFGHLRLKHKKLKKRYNELEGYLYAADSDDDEEKPKPKQTQPQQLPPQQLQQQLPPQQQLQEEPQPAPAQYVQRRFVRSWRDIRPQ